MSFSKRTAAIAAAISSVAGIGTLVATAPGVAAVDPTAPVLARTVSGTNIALTGSLSTDLATEVALDAADAVETATVEAVAETSVDSATSAVNFSSLGDAVAAQVRPEAVSDELACLAHATYYESKGEPLEGQLAVAEVIVNRAASGRFPGSVCGVVRQPGQFSFVRGGRIPEPNRASAAWREALAVAQVAQSDAWDSSASDALFFHARRVSPGWRLKRVASVGNHIFYR